MQNSLTFKLLCTVKLYSNEKHFNTQHAGSNRLANHASQPWAGSTHRSIGMFVLLQLKPGLLQRNMKVPF